MSRNIPNLEQRLRRSAPPVPTLPRSLRTQVLQHSTTESDRELRQARYRTLGLALGIWLALSAVFFFTLPRRPATSQVSVEASEQPHSEWDLVERNRRIQQNFLEFLKRTF